MTEHDRYYLEGVRLLEKYVHIGGKPLPLPPDPEKINTAILKIRKAAELKPDCCSHYFFIGKGHQTLLEYQKAAAAFKKGIEIDNDHKYAADFYSEYANCLLNLEKYDLAFEMLQRAISERPQSHFFKANLAIACVFLGNIEKANTLIDEVTEADPKDPVVLTCKAVILLKEKLGYLPSYPELENGKHDEELRALQQELS